MSDESNEQIRERICDRIREQGYRVEERSGGLFAVYDDVNKTVKCICIRVKACPTHHRQTDRDEYGIDLAMFNRLCAISRQTEVNIIFADRSTNQSYSGTIGKLLHRVRIWDRDRMVFVPRDSLTAFASW
jgi:hypothetical protein